VITGQFTGQGLHCFDYTPPDDGFYEYNANFHQKSQYRACLFSYSDFHENRRCHAKGRSPAVGGVGLSAPIR
jgi:hypothetical protein